MIVWGKPLVIVPEPNMGGSEMGEFVRWTILMDTEVVSSSRCSGQVVLTS